MASLTVWEAKERAYLLSCETDEWRQNRLLAEDPDATADALERLTDRVLSARSSQVVDVGQYFLTGFALIAHPNTSARCLVQLLPWCAMWSCFEFCQNPVMPFLVLEMPDFFERLGGPVCERLLKEETLPPSVAHILTRHSDPAVSKSAPLHVALAGEIQTRAEGMEAITAYWHGVCRNGPTPAYTETPPHRGGPLGRYPSEDWHAELTALHLAPQWASAMTPRTLPKRRLIRRVLLRTVLPWRGLKVLSRMRRASLEEYARQAFVLAAGEHHYNMTELAKFVAALHGAFRLDELHALGTSMSWDYTMTPVWIGRLCAALKLPITPKPIGPMPGIARDPTNRSPLDLMHRLSCDGNRLVRWAAETRLANPDFTFAWHEEGA